MPEITETLRAERTNPLEISRGVVKNLQSRIPDRGKIARVTAAAGAAFMLACSGPEEETYGEIPTQSQILSPLKFEPAPFFSSAEKEGKPDKEKLAELIVLMENIFKPTLLQNLGDYKENRLWLGWNYRNVEANTVAYLSYQTDRFAINIKGRFDGDALIGALWEIQDLRELNSKLLYDYEFQSFANSMLNTPNKVKWSPLFRQREGNRETAINGNWQLPNGTTVEATVLSPGKIIVHTEILKTREDETNYATLVIHKDSSEIERFAEEEVAKISTGQHLINLKTGVLEKTASSENDDLLNKLKERLIIIAREINGILPPDKQAGYLTIYGNPNVSFIDGQDRGGGIQIYSKSDTEIPFAWFEIVAFHEGMHLFGNANGKSFLDFQSQLIECCLNYMTIDDTRIKTKQAIQKLQRENLTPQEIFDRLYGVKMGKGYEGFFESMPVIFRLFDESSYVGKEIGHPLSNAHELFASTATVLRLFPQSFIQSTETLVPKDRQFAKSLARMVIEFLRNNASNRVKIDSIFDPELFNYLYSEQ